MAEPIQREAPESSDDLYFRLLAEEIQEIFRSAERQALSTLDRLQKEWAGRRAASSVPAHVSRLATTHALLTGDIEAQASRADAAVQAYLDAEILLDARACEEHIHST